MCGIYLHLTRNSEVNLKRSRGKNIVDAMDMEFQVEPAMTYTQEATSCITWEDDNWI